MQRDNKIYSFDIVIFFLLFGLLPVDMLNGFLLREVQLTPVITISQLYKIVVLALLFIRITTTERIIVFVIFGLLLLPSFFQVVTSFNLKLILVDAVKVIKYLASFIAFLYFRSIFINKGHLLDRVYKWMFFSFIIIVLNIFLRLFGIGFPMYTMQGLEIGSKGFFYAGNEISATLLIISSFLMYWFKLYNKPGLFIFIGVLAIVTGLYATTKTAILGTIFTFIYFLFLMPRRNMLTIKSLFIYIIFFFICMPIGGYFIIDYLESSDIMRRIAFFWDKLDIYTFILSNRNTFLFDMIEIFKEKYNIVEMLIGVGQSTFESLNNDHIIELDFFDIYFAYGLIGVLLFVLYTLFILIKAKLKLFSGKTFVFAPYTTYIALLLIVLSFLSAHIFNSGMAAIFIGCVFSLMYYKSNYENKIS